jgi:hypothetical protein
MVADQLSQATATRLCRGEKDDEQIEIRHDIDHLAAMSLPIECRKPAGLS